MATILNIETSTDVCSVALTSSGFILCHREDFEGPNHAAVLSDFIIYCMDYLREHDNMKLDAISVSLGPGSYTGLRIGMSEAKGLAYGLDVPLIGINTLKILAVEAMFGLTDFNPDEDIIIPMIDARRDEVYTASLNGILDFIDEPYSCVLSPDSFKNKFEDKRLIFVGNGSKKAEKILSLEDREKVFLTEMKPLATTMCALSEKCYNDKQFIDVAYSVPFYLKEFQTTRPKRRI